jgi:hypothetical protein
LYNAHRVICGWAADDKFALRGRWSLDDQGATADSDQLDLQVSKGLQVFSFTFG